MQGIVFKEILCNDFDYIIVKYSTLNTIKYQVKIWMSGHYIPLYLCNNPRQAINFIKNAQENSLLSRRSQGDELCD